MKWIARKALTIADELDQLLTDILDDDRTARAGDEYSRGYISQDEVDILEESIRILQDYGRSRAN